MAVIEIIDLLSQWKKFKVSIDNSKNNWDDSFLETGKDEM